jgi:hypothetical protein
MKKLTLKRAGNLLRAGNKKVWWSDSWIAALRPQGRTDTMKIFFVSFFLIA